MVSRSQAAPRRSWLELTWVGIGMLCAWSVHSALSGQAPGGGQSASLEGTVVSVRLTTTASGGTPQPEEPLPESLAKAGGLEPAEASPQVQPPSSATPIAPLKADSPVDSAESTSGAGQADGAVPPSPSPSQGQGSHIDSSTSTQQIGAAPGLQLNQAGLFAGQPDGPTSTPLPALPGLPAGTGGAAPGGQPGLLPGPQAPPEEAFVSRYNDRPFQDVAVVALLVDQDGIVHDVRLVIPSRYALQDTAFMAAARQQRIKGLDIPPGQQRWVEFRLAYAHKGTSDSIVP